MSEAGVPTDVPESMAGSKKQITLRRARERRPEERLYDRRRKAETR
jgi:hypothetical protein